MQGKYMCSGSALRLGTSLIVLSVVAGAQSGSTACMGTACPPPPDSCVDAVCTSSSAPPPVFFPPISLRNEKTQNIRDATRIAWLAAEVKEELENGSHLMLSVETVKKTDEMLKLSRQLHERLKGNTARQNR